MRVFFLFEVFAGDDERLSLPLIGRGKLLLAGLFAPAGFYWSRSELKVASVGDRCIAISRSPLCDMYFTTTTRTTVGSSIYEYVRLCW